MLPIINNTADNASVNNADAVFLQADTPMNVATNHDRMNPGNIFR
jgi:hypothetical protein